MWINGMITRDSKEPEKTENKYAARKRIYLFVFILEACGQGFGWLVLIRMRSSILALPLHLCSETQVPDSLCHRGTEGSDGLYVGCTSTAAQQMASSRMVQWIKGPMRTSGLDGLRFTAYWIDEPYSFPPRHSLPGSYLLTSRLPALKCTFPYPVAWHSAHLFSAEAVSLPFPQ